MVPKGPIETGQAPLAAAQREFAEEAGLAPSPISHPLAPLRKAGGEPVLGWTREGDLDLAASRPGRFEMEWSPRSGRRAIFQKIDPIAAFDGPQAIWRVLPSQAPLIREGLQILCEPP
jgi:predicted NUDIX family NTP pyrophosphohydrolase